MSLEDQLIAYLEQVYPQFGFSVTGDLRDEFDIFTDLSMTPADRAAIQTVANRWIQQNVNRRDEFDFMIEWS